MAPHQYVEKPGKVDAEQYAAATMPGVPDPIAWPWVCTCTRNPLFPTGAPHVHGTEGQQGLAEGDWIVGSTTNAAKYWAMSDADFSELYGPGGGQPLPEDA